MRKLSLKQRQLWKELQGILWKDWDPIGVYEEGSKWDDEYDSYVPHLFKLVTEGADHIKISAYLTSVINQSIGLSTAPNNELEMKIAKLVIGAKHRILGD
ncbi:hypothetical protein [Pseudoalteromonas luteoviolacea]|uniref:Uncharacterized protein n=1 Tax=Pseudoalteromonas luteoviolacea S4060-1 TaxID=1365257 RepID=A0A167PDH0_9GAMM|nr:hypothetical protein [Pseudoalteromonas luteoviolacea]KZN70400.1 hypothetical protein N478_00420 [Pseudoalteromonas luteoviolacea S4060-1]